MKKTNFTKLYCRLGKILCGTAGAIIGYITAGIVFALAGLFLGIIAGHLFENTIIGKITQIKQNTI